MESERPVRSTMSRSERWKACIQLASSRHSATSRVAASRSRPARMPAASSAALSAPELVPTTCDMRTPRSIRTSSAPASKAPLATPPARTTAILEASASMRHRDIGATAPSRQCHGAVTSAARASDGSSRTPRHGRGGRGAPCRKRATGVPRGSSASAPGSCAGRARCPQRPVRRREVCFRRGPPSMRRSRSSPRRREARVDGADRGRARSGRALASPRRDV